MSPLFVKMINSFHFFNTWCLTGLFLPQYSIVLILVYRKTCWTVTASWHTSTYNMLHSLSYIRKQYNGGFWTSLKIFHFTISNTRARFMILTVCPYHWIWFQCWWRQQDLQQYLCSCCSPFNIHLLNTEAPTVTKWMLETF